MYWHLLNLFFLACIDVFCSVSLFAKLVEVFALVDFKYFYPLPNLGLLWSLTVIVCYFSAIQNSVTGVFQCIFELVHDLRGSEFSSRSARSFNSYFEIPKHIKRLRTSLATAMIQICTISTKYRSKNEFPLCKIMQLCLQFLTIYYYFALSYFQLTCPLARWNSVFVTLSENLEENVSCSCKCPKKASRSKNIVESIYIYMYIVAILICCIIIFYIFFFFVHHG